MRGKLRYLPDFLDFSFDIAGLNQTASQAGAAAERVLGASTGLNRQADALRAEIDKFLRNIRAA